ncbi:unnamed protein product [Ectocarpus sp. 6 AP-2014]
MPNILQQRNQRSPVIKADITPGSSTKGLQLKFLPRPSHPTPHTFRITLCHTCPALPNCSRVLGTDISTHDPLNPPTRRLSVRSIRIVAVKRGKKIATPVCYLPIHTARYPYLHFAATVSRSHGARSGTVLFWANFPTKTVVGSASRGCQYCNFSLMPREPQNHEQMVECRAAAPATKLPPTPPESKVKQDHTRKAFDGAS